MKNPNKYYYLPSKPVTRWTKNLPEPGPIEQAFGKKLHDLVAAVNMQETPMLLTNNFPKEWSWDSKSA